MITQPSNKVAWAIAEGRPPDALLALITAYWRMYRHSPPCESAVEKDFDALLNAARRVFEQDRTLIFENRDVAEHGIAGKRCRSGPPDLPCQ